MARTTPPVRDHVDAPFVRAVEEAVRRAGALPLAKLTKEKLTPEAREALEKALVAAGLERLPKLVRVPLAAQILALVQAGARVSVKDVGKRVKGASPKTEIKASLDALRKQGRVRVVIRTEAEVVVGAGDEVLEASELLRLVKLGAALAKTLKKVGAKGLPRGLLREDVAALLSPLGALAGAHAEPSAPAEAPRDDAAGRRALVDEVMAHLEDPALKLVPVAQVVRALDGRLALTEVHRALGEAAEAGRIELQPAAGSELLAPADAALCPPGPRGTVLFFARRLAP